MLQGKDCTQGKISRGVLGLTAQASARRALTRETGKKLLLFRRGSFAGISVALLFRRAGGGH